MRNITKILLTSFALLSNIVYTQSYYYSDDLRGSRAKGIVENVYRINLVTGEKKLILSGVGNPAVLSDINKIMFKSIPESQICMYDIKQNSIDTLSYLGKIELKNQNHTVPPDNHIFLSCVKFGAKIISREFQTLESTDILIDKNTHSIIDTNCYYFRASRSLFSRDGKKIYYLLKSKDGICFKSRSTDTGEIINQEFSIEKYNNLQLERNTWLSSAIDGYALIGYRSKVDNIRHYVLCDLENRKSIVEFSWSIGVGINTYITPECKNIIIEIEDYTNEDRYFSTGSIYILDGNTAIVKQRLRFQTSENKKAGSKIVILGDSLYFFPEDPKESDASHFDNIVHADLTQVQSNTSLAEMMTDDVENAYHKGWIDNKGIYNSLRKKLQNAQKQIDKGKPKQAINQLNVFLNHLESQKGKHVNEQAYNLLHFNAKQLMERLKE
ncbi:hypothetical protein J7K93_02585 [bacterium]|nr:hypothetical protein [bacterium]